MNWYNPKRWLNLTFGIYVLGLIILAFIVGLGIIGYSLYDPVKSKVLFPWQAITEGYPIKANVLISGAATFGTLVLAFVALITIKNNNDREQKRIEAQNEKDERDKKERLLHEVRDWIFEIKNVTLVPVTEDSMAFSQENISLRYGAASVKVEYFENAVWKFFRDEDSLDKVAKVGAALTSVMVIHRAKQLNGIIDSEDFKAFPKRWNLRDQLLKEYKEKQVELQRTIEDKTRIPLEITFVLWDKYVIELAEAESNLLSKLTDIASSLI